MTVARYLYGVIHRASTERTFHRQLELAIEAAERVPGGAVLIEYLVAGHDLLDLVVAALNDEGWFHSARPIGSYSPDGDEGQVADMPPQREPLRLVTDETEKDEA